MRFVDRYPIIVTPLFSECRDFWRTHLGFEVVFEATWFVLLQADGATLAFMSPDHPSAPPGPEPFSGKGMCFELQVEDATLAYETCRSRGLAGDYPLTEEPFGQRRFGFFDPSGLWVDIIEQIEPAQGFWDRYLTA
ncbi:VOC family protein [Phenylobacterium sp.]|uniref:VOC family protein n=1 Tax=Phenylobacterium sp. TaxID=1871053 RepID=UPI0027360284|nr:VOC family protein [Phenylobacterium sp.]MDP3852089.1 VOC family protein [Phenylobacterium sp.]